MVVVPLVPETKMADVGKLISLGTYWSGKSRGLCSQLRPQL